MDSPCSAAGKRKKERGKRASLEMAEMQGKADTQYIFSGC